MVDISERNQGVVVKLEAGHVGCLLVVVMMENSMTKSPMLSRQRRQAFTLMEVVISIALMGLVFGGILTAYVQSAKRAEWSGHSLAAQAFGIQQLEQARAAVWDSTTNQITNLNLTAWTPVGSLTNAWKGYAWTTLDIPYSGTNYVWATNFVTLTNVTILTTPKLTVWMMRVDTVWRHRGHFYTNTLANYFAPDQ